MSSTEERPLRVGDLVRLKQDLTGDWSEEEYKPGMPPRSIVEIRTIKYGPNAGKKFAQLQGVYSSYPIDLLERAKK